MLVCSKNARNCLKQQQAREAAAARTKSGTSTVGVGQGGNSSSRASILPAPPAPVLRGGAKQKPLAMVRKGSPTVSGNDGSVVTMMPPNQRYGRGRAPPHRVPHVPAPRKQQPIREGSAIAAATTTTAVASTMVLPLGAMITFPAGSPEDFSQLTDQTMLQFDPNSHGAAGRPRSQEKQVEARSASTTNSSGRVGSVPLGQKSQSSNSKEASSSSLSSSRSFFSDLMSRGPPCLPGAKIVPALGEGASPHFERLARRNCEVAAAEEAAEKARTAARALWNPMGARSLSGSGHKVSPFSDSKISPFMPYDPTVRDGSYWMPESSTKSTAQGVNAGTKKREVDGFTGPPSPAFTSASQGTQHQKSVDLYRKHERDLKALFQQLKAEACCDIDALKAEKQRALDALNAKTEQSLNKLHGAEKALKKGLVNASKELQDQVDRGLHSIQNTVTTTLSEVKVYTSDVLKSTVHRVDATVKRMLGLYKEDPLVERHLVDQSGTGRTCGKSTMVEPTPSAKGRARQQRALSPRTPCTTVVTKTESCSKSPFLRASMGTKQDKWSEESSLSSQSQSSAPKASAPSINSVRPVGAAAYQGASNGAAATHASDSPKGSQYRGSSLKCASTPSTTTPTEAAKEKRAAVQRRAEPMNGPIRSQPENQLGNRLHSAVAKKRSRASSDAVAGSSAIHPSRPRRAKKERREPRGIDMEFHGFD